MNRIAGFIDNGIRLTIPPFPTGQVAALLRRATLANQFRKGHCQVLLYREEGDTLFLPRGFAEKLFSLAERLGVSLDMQDRRTMAPITFPSLKAALTVSQGKSLDDVNGQTQGVIIPPADSAIMGLALIERCGQRAVILVNSWEALTQWAGAVRRLFGIAPGVIHEGQWEPGQHVTVAMARTLGRDWEGETALFGETGLLLADGCHQADDAFYQVVQRSSAHFRYGFSISPGYGNGKEFEMFRSFGPLLTRVDGYEVEESGALPPMTSCPVCPWGAGVKPWA